MVERPSRDRRVTKRCSTWRVVPRGDLRGRPLLCDVINLLYGDHLIWLLSERGHCRLVVAIVCVAGLKDSE